jgi:DNA repair exonuclease SbcCD ATPase subunit
LTKYSDSLSREIEKLKEVNENKSENKIDEYEQELKQIEKTYNDLIEERNVLTAAGVLLKDGGIKSKIVKQYIPVINKLINKYLSAMDFFVSFELDENFNETIKSRYRDDFTYASFSEGEKQKIDLALLFTWRAVAKLRNSINTNLLIMDEVFDSSLDMNAVDYLMNIIRDVSKDSNIIIISHKEHMNEKFNNVLKFVKNKNFSQIQE